MWIISTSAHVYVIKHKDVLCNDGKQVPTQKPTTMSFFKLGYLYISSLLLLEQTNQKLSPN